MVLGVDSVTDVVVVGSVSGELMDEGPGKDGAHRVPVAACLLRCIQPPSAAPRAAIHGQEWEAGAQSTRQCRGARLSTMQACLGPVSTEFLWLCAR